MAKQHLTVTVTVDMEARCDCGIPTGLFHEFDCASKDFAAATGDVVDAIGQVKEVKATMVHRVDSSLFDAMDAVRTS